MKRSVIRPEPRLQALKPFLVLAQQRTYRKRRQLCLIKAQPAIPQPRAGATSHNIPGQTTSETT